MIYKFGEKYVVFTEEVVNTLHKYKQLSYEAHESGGILLGKVYNDLIIIDQVSEPSKEDDSGRYYFFRNVKKAQRIAEQAWKESNGERLYLGEWHTHPEDVPTPSRDDRTLLKNMLKHSRINIDFLFMIIIGRDKPYMAVLNKRMVKMEPLNRIKATDGLNITIYKNKDKIYGFQVTGFLDFAPKAYNAAFSTIFVGTVNAISALTNLEDYVFEHTQGFIRFLAPDSRDEKSQTIMDIMLVQINTVLQEMKNTGMDKFVEIHYKEQNI
ncbi:Mov34/MPN/PAD-1 family protein [Lysinibacillus sp. FSL W8-0953]|uniref:Mov34/MPN/PAD-1 family protein n=1 Tax=Lysinibacillus sp. FSL W8-0953 TaxID=2954640 RepID=UPI0030F68BC6